jgi:hypothetical protein
LISRIHNKLGTAGFIVAIVALVAALSGVAIAAAGLNSKQKKEVKKIAKQFAGKDGAPGATGPAGPAGAPGAKGDAGAAGQDGAPGKEGKEGPQGKEGKEGPQGKEGSPWTAGGVLPSGKTETGAWSVGIGPKETVMFSDISFNIPLTAAPKIIYGEEETTDCPGTVEDPKAAKGNLCIYIATAEGVVLFPLFKPVPFKTGAVVPFLVNEEGSAFGTWAVTAP